MILLFLSLAWILGIFTGSLIRIPLWTLALCLIPLSIIPFLLKYWKTLCLIAVLVIMLLAGGVFAHRALPRITPECAQFYNNIGDVTIEGMIADDPDIRDRSVSFKFAARKVNFENARIEVSGYILVKTLPLKDYCYGDILRISGALETPRDFSSFGYRGYLANQEIYTVTNFPYIEVLDKGQGIKPLQWIYALRRNLSQSINAALPEPHASLAQGIFLGITGNIPSDLREAFTRTGTSHILAISGMNLTIVIGILLGIGIWVFGRQYSIYVWLSLVIIWIYTILTGMRPPIIRSAVMGSIFLFAELLGRQKNALVALAFTAALMIGFNPGIIRDAAFQLSFLSMCGLILIHPRLQRIFISENRSNSESSFLRKTAYLIFDSFMVTLAALIPTWPVIVYHFNVVSLFGLPATVFILPVLPGIILTTAIVSIAGMFIPLVAQIIGWLDWVLLSYYTLIVNIFNVIPLSSVKLANISAWHLLFYYAILTLVWFCADQRNTIMKIAKKAAASVMPVLKIVYSATLKLPLKWITLVLLMVNLLVWLAVFSLPDDKLHVSVLDVGQGEAMLIQTPEGQNILIDGGPSSQKLELQLGKKLPFWDRHLDLVISTQPQLDHINALSSIFETYPVGSYIYTPATADSATYSRLMRIVEAKELDHTAVYYPQQVNLCSDICLQIIHPPANLLQCPANESDCNGLVLLLVYREVSFLLTADIDGPTETYLIGQRANLNCTVLKVAHHGSRNSSTTEFLAIAKPHSAVISSGKDNSYGHPHPETLARLYEIVEPEYVFNTAENGTIEFVSDGTRLWVKTDK